MSTYKLRQSNTLIKNRYGIELEFKHAGYSRNEIAETLALEFGNKFIIKTDGSFHGSEDYSEVCTSDNSFTSGNRGLNLWTDLVDTLNKKYHVSETGKTGFHIHHDVSDLTPKQISNTITFYFNFERIIDLVMPSSRRSTEHVDNVQQLSIHYVKDIQRLAKTHPENRDEFWRLCPKGTYNSLRISSRFQTLEFRRNIFTVDDRKLHNWTKFTQSMIKYASRQKTFRPIYTESKRNSFTRDAGYQDKRVFDYFGKNKLGWATVLSRTGAGLIWAFRQVFEYSAGNLNLCREFEKRSLKLNDSPHDVIKGLTDNLERLYNRV